MSVIRSVFDCRKQNVVRFNVSVCHVHCVVQIVKTIGDASENKTYDFLLLFLRCARSSKLGRYSLSDFWIQNVPFLLLVPVGDLT